MKPISRPVRRGLILFFLTVALASIVHLALWAMQSYQSGKVQDGLEQLYHQGGLTIGQSDPNQEVQAAYALRPAFSARPEGQIPSGNPVGPLLRRRGRFHLSTA